MGQYPERGTEDRLLRRGKLKGIAAAARAMLVVNVMKRTGPPVAAATVLKKGKATSSLVRSLVRVYVWVA